MELEQMMLEDENLDMNEVDAEDPIEKLDQEAME